MFFTGGGLAAKRDFVLFEHTQYNSDGSIYVAFGSIEDAIISSTKTLVYINTKVRY